MLLTILVCWFSLSGRQTYVSGRGEQRSVLLDDGSRVTLNTASEIEVDIDDARRTVRLLRGEALFQVVHDGRRPFDVVAAGTTVRAVGTRFDVELQPSHTTITVVEGKVAVFQEGGSSAQSSATPTFVAAAQSVVVTGRTVSSPKTVANVAISVAWTDRRLIFERRSLGDVADEFNRYNVQRIKVDGARLSAREVTGTFDANDPDSFIAFLSETPGVVVHRAADGTRIVTEDEK
jgi:transmembrane sensor